uniref:SPEF1 protein n=1 Tax=Apteryx owenii TaxID=8824 RepID=A0A8B9PMY0_APTOW
MRGVARHGAREEVTSRSLQPCGGRGEPRAAEPCSGGPGCARPAAEPGRGPGETPEPSACGWAPAKPRGAPRRDSSLALVLSKLNFCIPDEMIRKIVQCRPGLVEQVLIVLRQKIEEKQRQNKVVSGSDQLAHDLRSPGGVCPPALAVQAKSSAAGGSLSSQRFLSCPRLNRSHHGYAQASPEDAAFRLQLAEREQALLLAQETIQILQVKVRRLEQLVHLKNIQIDDLSQRLQEAEHKQK